MTSTSAPVPYQTFDMALVAGSRPGSVLARPPARRPAADPLHERLLALLPKAATVLFVGQLPERLRAAYLERHPAAVEHSVAWNTTLSADAAACELIVAAGLGRAEAPADLLQALATNGPALASLFVCEAPRAMAAEPLCTLLMDAGWMPDLVHGADGQSSDGLIVQAVNRFGALPANTGTDTTCFSVVVPTSAGREASPAAASSPGLAEVQATVTAVGDATSAADALAAAAPALAADWVLLCHEDAYFPAGFGTRLNALLADIPAAERQTSLIGFIGIGVDARQQGFAPAGFVVEQLRREDHPASASAVSIDELAVVVARESLHQIDPAFGWHLWATDLCLTAICKHQVFPRIVTLPLLHRTSQARALPAEFHASAERLSRKFEAFGPIPTLNGSIDAAFLERHRPQRAVPVAAAQPVVARPAMQAANPGPSLSLRGQPVATSTPTQAATRRAPDPTPATGPVIGQCAICEQGVAQWTPHPQRGLRSEFMKLLDAVGSDLSVYQCPHCGSNDRDRHLWHYLRAVGLLQRLPSARILHIAPERHIEALIQAMAPRAYLRGDLFPRRADHLKLDVEALPFDDASFDLVICNHVLEHVASPARALAEFHRCLGSGGVLIAQTPYAPSLKNTLEMNRPVSPAFAKLFYGQDDHVRLFGADIAGYFHAAGFSGDLLPHEAVLGSMDAKAQGCNGREPFFAFSK